MGQRTMLVTAHTGRADAVRSARLVAERLPAAGIAVRTLEAGELSYPGAEEVPAARGGRRAPSWSSSWAATARLLRAAELSRPAGCR